MKARVWHTASTQKTHSFGDLLLKPSGVPGSVSEARDTTENETAVNSCSWSHKLVRGRIRTRISLTAAAKLVMSASISLIMEAQRKYREVSRLRLDTEQHEQEPRHQVRLGALDCGQLVLASCSSLSYESSPHICRLLCRHRAFW